MERLEGLYVATLTPFLEDGRVDPGAIRALVERLTLAGVAGLAPCGTTGEFLYLSTGEKVRVVEETVRAAAGRSKVVAGVWALTERETAMLARGAEAAGADAVFLPPPVYYAASDETIFHWYAGVHAATSLPVFAYNIPACAANGISLECVERLVAEGVIAGIKDSTGNADRMSALVDRFGARTTVMAASDSFVSEARRLGAAGFISALANIYPAEVRRIWDGDSSLQPALDSVRDAVKKGGGIPALKRLLTRAGIGRPFSRLPGVPLTAEQESALHSAHESLIASV